MSKQPQNLRVSIIVLRYLIRKGFNAVGLWLIKVLKKQEMKESVILWKPKKMRLRGRLEMRAILFLVGD